MLINGTADYVALRAGFSALPCVAGLNACFVLHARATFGVRSDSHCG
jgi:hypothetical protein